MFEPLTANIFTGTETLKTVFYFPKRDAPDDGQVVVKAKFDRIDPDGVMARIKNLMVIHPLRWKKVAYGRPLKVRLDQLYRFVDRPLLVADCPAGCAIAVKLTTEECRAYQRNFLGGMSNVSLEKFKNDLRTTVQKVVLEKDFVHLYIIKPGDGTAILELKRDGVRSVSTVEDNGCACVRWLNPHHYPVLKQNNGQ